MKQFLLAMTSLILAACTSSMHPSAIEPVNKLAAIQARGTLIIATDADYWPQSRLISGSQPARGTKCEPTQYAANQFEGFDVDVARVVADRLGVEHVLSHHPGANSWAAIGVITGMFTLAQLLSPMTV